MKVLHVISDTNIGGAGVLLCNLLSHFDGEIESAVALPKGSALEERIKLLGVNTHPLTHAVDRADPRAILEVRRLIRRCSPDIVHANAALGARIASRCAHIPVIHTRHCCFAPSGVFAMPILSNIPKFCNAHLSDRVIATAHAAARNLLSLGVKRERIRIIINGSEPVRGVSEAELEHAREHYGISHDEYVVGICARLEACKGHMTFLRAIKQLLQMPRVRRFRFLIVGSGSMEKELRIRVKEMGIENFVSFTGFVSDMAPIYHLMHINVNCSEGTETSCLALSEGMSASLPMVISDYGGNPDMIGKSNAGFLFPAGNSQALAEAIFQLASNECLERQMRASALARYESSYTAKRMADEVAEVYRELYSPRSADAIAK